MIDIMYFFIKAIIVVLAILLILKMKKKGAANQSGQLFSPINIEKVNDTFSHGRKMLLKSILDKKKLKLTLKTLKNKKRKATRNYFVIDFQGDVKATGTKQLRQLVSMIISIAQPKSDHVIVRLDSRGGTVTGYGLAAAQLKRLTDHKIRLYVTIDEFAASGGYMMAAVADSIYASPFSMIGSIGVISQLPNFHKLLKKNDIDFEMITAGKYKRTLTMLGKNTDEGREKYKEDLEKIHTLFINHVKKHRPQVKDTVFTGEVWPALLAKKHELVDELITSDEFIQRCLASGDVYYLSQKKKLSPLQKLTKQAAQLVKRFDEHTYYIDG